MTPDELLPANAPPPPPPPPRFVEATGASSNSSKLSINTFAFQTH